MGCWGVARASEREFRMRAGQMCEKALIVWCRMHMRGRLNPYLSRIQSGQADQRLRLKVS